MRRVLVGKVMAEALNESAEAELDSGSLAGLTAVLRLLEAVADVRLGEYVPRRGRIVFQFFP
jgi:hypothetical protein